MKKKGLLLILVLAACLTIIPVKAKENSGFFAQDDLIINKEVDSSLFAAGNTVDVDATVNGSSFVAGSEVNIGGTHDLIFAAGKTVNLSNANTKDAFVAGQDIKIEEASIRDLYAAGDTIRILSTINRNLYAAGSTITIDSTINGDVYLAAERIKIGDNAVINGTLKYSSDSKISISEEATIGKKITYTSSTTTVSKPSFRTMIISEISSLLGLLFTGIVLLYGYGKLFKELEKAKFDSDTIIKTSVKGLVVLIVLPIAAIIAMCTGIGFPVALIALVAYFIIMYLSSIVTAYYVGNKFLRGKIDNQYLLLIASLICLFVIKLIPYIGGIVGFITLCFGIGFLFDVIKPHPTKNK